eukprot:403376361
MRRDIKQNLFTGIMSKIDDSHKHIDENLSEEDKLHKMLSKKKTEILSLENIQDSDLEDQEEQDKLMKIPSFETINAVDSPFNNLSPKSNKNLRSLFARPHISTQNLNTLIPHPFSSLPISPNRQLTTENQKLLKVKKNLLLKLKAATQFTTRPHTLKEIMSCLGKEQTNEDITFMKDYFSKFLFMEDVVKGEDTYRFIFQIMKHQYFEKDATIFNYNDQGDLFYIILQGRVSIKVPKTSVQELNHQEFLEYHSCENLLSIKELTEEELQAYNNALQHNKKSINLLSPATNEKNSISTPLIDKHQSNGNNKFQPILSTQNLGPKKFYNVTLLSEVAVLDRGMHFGELAIIKTGKKRTATVTTLEETHFVVMDKKSYTRAMGKATKSRLQEKVDFLKNYKIFQGIQSGKLENLTYFLHKVEFNRGQLIYREGKDVMDKIYFIKQGEFEVTKTIVLPTKKEKDITNYVEGSHIDYKKFKQQQNLLTFNKKLIGPKQEQAQICILGNLDFFGMEEFLNPDKQRLFTITCIKNKSECFYFPKDALGEVAKKNMKIINQYKDSWFEFVEKRILSFYNAERNFKKDLVKKPSLDIQIKRPNDPASIPIKMKNHKILEQQKMDFLSQEKQQRDIYLEQSGKNTQRTTDRIEKLNQNSIERPQTSVSPKKTLNLKQRTLDIQLNELTILTSQRQQTQDLPYAERQLYHSLSPLLHKPIQQYSATSIKESYNPYENNQVSTALIASINSNSIQIQPESAIIRKSNTQKSLNLLNSQLQQRQEQALADINQSKSKSSFKFPEQQNLITPNSNNPIKIVKQFSIQEQLSSIEAEKQQLQQPNKVIKYQKFNQQLKTSRNNEPILFVNSEDNNNEYFNFVKTTSDNMRLLHQSPQTISSFKSNGLIKQSNQQEQSRQSTMGYSKSTSDMRNSVFSIQSNPYLQQNQQLNKNSSSQIKSFNLLQSQSQASTINLPNQNLPLITTSQSQLGSYQIQQQLQSVTQSWYYNQTMQTQDYIQVQRLLSASPNKQSYQSNLSPQTMGGVNGGGGTYILGNIDIGRRMTKPEKDKHLSKIKIMNQRQKLIDIFNKNQQESNHKQSQSNKPRRTLRIHDTK